MIGSAIRKLLGKYGAGKEALKYADSAASKAKRFHHQKMKDSQTYRDIANSDTLHNVLSATGVKGTKSESRRLGIANRSYKNASAKSFRSKQASKIQSMSAAEIRKLKSFKTMKAKNPKLTVKEFKKKTAVFIGKGNLETATKRSKRTVTDVVAHRGARLAATAGVASIALSDGHKKRKDERRYK